MPVNRLTRRLCLLLAALLVLCPSASYALLGLTPEEVAKELGVEPNGEAQPLEHTESAEFYEVGRYLVYVAYDASGKAVYTRVERTDERMAVAEAQKLRDRLIPGDLWERQTMPDLRTYVWENGDHMRRAEFDMRQGRLFVFELAWQDVAAGRPPRAPAPKATVVQVEDPMLGNQKLTPRQSKLLRRMLPKDLPRVNPTATKAPEDGGALPESDGGEGETDR